MERTSLNKTTARQLFFTIILFCGAFFMQVANGGAYTAGEIGASNSECFLPVVMPIGR